MKIYNELSGVLSRKTKNKALQKKMEMKDKKIYLMYLFFCELSCIKYYFIKINKNEKEKLYAKKIFISIFYINGTVN